MIQLDRDGYRLTNDTMNLLGVPPTHPNRLAIYAHVKEVVSRGCQQRGMIDTCRPCLQQKMPVCRAVVEVRNMDECASQFGEAAAARLPEPLKRELVDPRVTNLAAVCTPQADAFVRSA